MNIRLANHFYIKQFCCHCDEPIDLGMLEEHLKDKHIDIIEEQYYTIEADGQ